MRAWSVSSSISTSPTPALELSLPTRVARHPLGVHDPGHGDHLVAANDERPPFTIGARDLCVDEHILHLLLPAGETVAGTPSPYSKPWQVGLDAPAAPVDRTEQIDRAALEPEPVVLAYRLQPAAEVDAPRAGLRVEQLGERGGSRAPLSSARSRFSRAPGWTRSRSGRISFRISPRTVAGFDESVRHSRPRSRQ